MHLKHKQLLYAFVIPSRVDKFIVFNKYNSSYFAKKNTVTPQKNFFIIFFCFISLQTLFFPKAFSQQTTAIKKQTEEKDKLPLKSRIAIKTNAVDWLLIAPNATLEFDVSNSIYNKYTVSLGIKGNWNTRQKYTPSIVYNFYDIRAEGRYYWRTERKTPIEGKTKLTDWVKDDLFSKKRLNPRYWRAYYIGLYTDYGDYSFKFGKEGIQGSIYGIGLSTGFGIPLYGYNDRFIDLELGGSIGMALTTYEKYTHDRASNCYPYIEGSKKNWHIVPFPVVNDLRVSFVFRFSSIKDKYKLVNHIKLAERQERTREKLIRRQEKAEVKEAEKEVKAKEREKQKEEKQKKENPIIQ